MYMWCVHCVLLDERIFSEEEAIKAAGCVWSDVKDVQLFNEVTVFVFEQVSVSQSHRYPSQDVAVMGGAGGCARIYEHMHNIKTWICHIYRLGLVCVLRSCVLVCTCVLV